MGSLIVGFALAGMAIGGAVGLLVGNGEGGVALGLTLGVFVGVTWVFIALVTRPRA
jgi:hypothetical protein